MAGGPVDLNESLYFTRCHVWDGGDYELALEIGPRSDDALASVMRRLWSSPLLRGPYLEKSREPDEMLVADQIPIEGTVFGLADLGSQRTVACAASPITFDDDRDWLYFFIPMGALGAVSPVGGFPFDADPHERWRRELDQWLADLARYVFVVVPFSLALIGHETGTLNHLDMATIAEHGVPEARYDALLLARGGSLEWYPRTRE